MTEIDFYGPDFTPFVELTYVIIGGRYRGEWVFIKHRKRKGFELPAGHIRDNEDPDSAASRELREETGAKRFSIECIATYTVRENKHIGAGRVFAR